MNKSGLIEALSRKENLTEKKAIDLVNLVFKGFSDELKKNGTTMTISAEGHEPVTLGKKAEA